MTIIALLGLVVLLAGIEFDEYHDIRKGAMAR